MRTWRHPGGRGTLAANPPLEPVLGPKDQPNAKDLPTVDIGSDPITDPLLDLEHELVVRRGSGLPQGRGATVLGIDARWRVAVISGPAEDLLGYPHGRLIGMSAESVAPELRELALWGFRARAMNEGLPPACRIDLTRHDGTSVSAQAAVEPVETTSGPLALVRLSGLRTEEDAPGGEGPAG